MGCALGPSWPPMALYMHRRAHGSTISNFLRFQARALMIAEAARFWQQPSSDVLVV